MLDDKFNMAIIKVLANEGGYVNDPKDSGGVTKYGISKRSYPKLDIKNLTIEDAKAIYYRDFWEGQKYKEIKSDQLSSKIFDLAVNVGISRAHMILQRALRAIGNPVKEDGIIGKITLLAVNSSNEKELLAAIKAEAAGYYRSIVAKNASQGKFLSGWLNRAYL